MKKVIGIWPIFLFFINYFLIGLLRNNFDNYSLMYAIIIASLGGIIFYKKDKISLKNKAEIFYNEATDNMILLIIIIFILAGIFCECVLKTGSVDAVINLGINSIPSSYFLPSIFIVSCLLSFALGTSCGTISALIPIVYGIGVKSDINLALLAGVVIGGAMFGDNLSFISDTTIAATKSMNIKMIDKFKTNFKLILPAFILNIILLFLVPININFNKNVSIDYLLLLPYIVIIIFSIIKVPVIWVLVSGIICAMFVGFYNNSIMFSQIPNILIKGFLNMDSVIVVTLLFAGLVGMIRYFGFNDNDIENMVSKIKRPEMMIATMVSAVVLLISNNCIAILSVAPVANQISDWHNLDRKRVASILDIFSSAVNGLIPYGAQILIASSLMNINGINIVWFNWYSFLLLITGIVSMGLYKKKKNGKDVMISEVFEKDVQ